MILHLTKSVKFHIILCHILYHAIIQQFLTGFGKSFLTAKLETNYSRTIIQSHLTIIIYVLPAVIFKVPLVQHIKIQILRSTCRNCQFFRWCIGFFIFFRERAEIIVNDRLMFFQLCGISI